MEAPDLPDPLVAADGRTITTPEEWRDVRRPEILELFRTHVYGRSPEETGDVRFDVFDEGRAALGGKAVRRQVAIDIAHNGRSLRIGVLAFLPAESAGPVPLLTLLNFGGNHTVCDDPAVPLPSTWLREDFRPPGEFRGAKRDRFPLENILSRGWGMATAYYGDIDPDFDDGFRNGVHPLFDPPGERQGDAWGSVGAWAWGLSRMMDYFETDGEIDHERIAVLGHSRLGKTALWAGAQDERFAVVISNNSGCTGASLSRHPKGESVNSINKNFPHWFCPNYRRYMENERNLPVDQHMLIALVAPRPVYVASATEDDWAGQEGEFLSCVHAAPVYRLFGLDGLGTATMPGPDSPLNEGHIGYHIRTGKHDLTAYDWERYVDFAGRKPGCDISRP
jgi:hypothetical protein